MSIIEKAPMTPATIDLVGTWRLVAVTDWVDGVITDPEAMGPQAAGYLTYTARGRVMVLLDRRSYARLSAQSRYGGEPIFAYAGTFTRTGDTVVHHLEMCTAVNEIGTDYIRIIEVAGDHLVLCTEPVSKDGKVWVKKLEWMRD